MTEIAATSMDSAEDLTTIRLDELLPQSPADVWRALTDSRIIERWLMKNDFKLELGHRFQFHTEPIPAVKFAGVVDCEVLAIEPERLLRYSWRDAGSENGLNSTVTWRLTPEGQGTRLHLEHAGFDPNNPLQQMGRRAMSGGWQSVPRRISALIEEDRAAGRL